jgi:hypothetical protein
MLCIAVRDFVSSVKKKQLVLFFKEIFSLPNIAAVITILPTFTLYYINNSVSGAESDAQIVQEAAGSVPFWLRLTKEPLYSTSSLLLRNLLY